MEREDALWLIRQALSVHRKDGGQAGLLRAQLASLTARLDQLKGDGQGLQLETILQEAREAHPCFFGYRG